MAHSRGHLSSHRKIMLGITVSLLNERRKELQEEARILRKGKKPFMKEYTKLCRKYRCYVRGNLQSVRAQRKGEEIYTITSHLSSLRRKGE